MRPVLYGDVSAVARMIYLLPDVDRGERVARIIECAEVAERHRLKTGRAHPLYGTGSLAAAAQRMARVSRRDFEDDRYCECWIEVLQALLTHRAAAS